MIDSPRNRMFSRRVPTRMTGVQLAAYFGLTEVIVALLKNIRYNPDIQYAFHRLPLSYAAENGCDMLVKLLLAKDGVQINSKDFLSGGSDPLALARGRRLNATAGLTRHFSPPLYRILIYAVN